MKQNETNDELYRAIYDKAVSIARRLLAKFTVRLEPIDAAGALLAAVLDLLLAELGDNETAVYLRTLAQEIENDVLKPELN